MDAYSTGKRKILCAVACDAKAAWCDRQDHYFAIPSKIFLQGMDAFDYKASLPERYL